MGSSSGRDFRSPRDSSLGERCSARARRPCERESASAAAAADTHGCADSSGPLSSESLWPSGCDADSSQSCFSRRNRIRIRIRIRIGIRIRIRIRTRSALSARAASRAPVAPTRRCELLITRELRPFSGERLRRADFVRTKFANSALSTTVRPEEHLAEKTRSSA